MRGALTNNFIENASESLIFDGYSNVPNGDTVRYHIKKNDIDEILKRFTFVFDSIFREAKKQGLLNSKVDLAIDWTSIKFYGKRDTKMVVGTKAERGTTKAYQFATVTIVEKNKRFVLRALPLESRDSEHLKAIVENLLYYAKSKVQINRVFFDRGFYSVAIISTLKKMDIHFLMPAKKSKNIKKLAEKVKLPATRLYRLKSKNKGTLVKLIFVESDKRSKNNNQANDEKEIGVFATNMSLSSDEIKELYLLYSKRWGIETSYRMCNTFRTKTAATDYSIRLFLFLFSIVLYNLWVLINACIFSDTFKRQGKGQIAAISFLSLLVITVACSPAANF
jgi:putative transposase